MIVRLPNPFNGRRTLTMCNGIHSRGVYGAVRSLTDRAVREANEQYLAERFPDGRFALLLRVPVVANNSMSPDLQNPPRASTNGRPGGLEEVYVSGSATLREGFLAAARMRRPATFLPTLACCVPRDPGRSRPANGTADPTPSSCPQLDPHPP